MRTAVIMDELVLISIWCGTLTFPSLFKMTIGFMFGFEVW